MHPHITELTFRTSSYTQQQNCVEVADIPGASAVRDTQNREHGHLLFSATEWQAALSTITRSV
ncbi:DUF397 domain-containing protein [Nocardiopsis sp. NPDC007018]|uniref:DUF397 domain-containing protein n=1 Tax=Nocardiopsis sp. NPDC007018 TaxID=3155721 RepID=UPI0033FECE26